MIHKFSIFIIEGLTDYEGGQVLGAYRTKAAAVAALDAYKAKAMIYDNDEFDGYSIAELVLDADIDQFKSTFTKH